MALTKEQFDKLLNQGFTTDKIIEFEKRRMLEQQKPIVTNIPMDTELMAKPPSMRSLQPMSIQEQAQTQNIGQLSRMTEGRLSDVYKNYGSAVPIEQYQPQQVQLPEMLKLGTQRAIGSVLGIPPSRTGELPIEETLRRTTDIGMYRDPTLKQLVSGIGSNIVIPSAIGAGIGTNPIGTLLGLAQGYPIFKGMDLLTQEAERRLPKGTSEPIKDIVGTSGYLGGLYTGGKILKRSIEGISNVSKKVKFTFDKFISPKIKGEKTLSKIKNYYKDAETVVNDISKSKPLGKNPESVTDFAESIKLRKDALFNEWKTIEQSAEGQGFKPVLTNVVDKLNKDFAKNPAYAIRPEIRKYAKDLAIRLWQTPRSIAEVAEQIKILNESGKLVYNDPSSVGKAKVDLVAAQELNKSLEQALDFSEGKLWKEARLKYKAYKTVEESVNSAILKMAKETNPTQFGNLLSTFGTTEIVAGIITANPMILSRGLTITGLNAANKWIRNPNRAIRSMFRIVEKAKLKGAK